MSLSLHPADDVVDQCEALLAHGRADEAAICLARASRQHPADNRILTLNGQALLALGETKAAIGALMLALRLQPGSAVAHSRLAEALMRSGDGEAALRHAGEAFRLAPDAINASMLSGTLCHLYRYAEALTFAETAHSLDPGEVSSWYPGLRVIRQLRPNDWGTTLLQLRDELTELALRKVPRLPGARARAEPLGPRGCKLCGALSPAIGQVDFNRSCEDIRQPPLPRAGSRVTYHRCPQCELVFTGDFDDWGFDQFRWHIYNADYAKVDPDYAVERPRCSTAFIAALLGPACQGMEVLDYGGGEGTLAALLSRDHGMQAVSYDPFDPATDELPRRRFPFVTCFEVLEHAPDPRATIRAIAGLVEESGFVLFSTLVQPTDFSRQGMNWWYVAPRNGHVTLFSAQALRAA